MHTTGFFFIRNINCLPFASTEFFCGYRIAPHLSVLCKLGRVFVSASEHGSPSCILVESSLRTGAGKAREYTYCVVLCFVCLYSVHRAQCCLCILDWPFLVLISLFLERLFSNGTWCIYVNDDPIITLWYLAFVVCLMCPLSTGSSILDFDFSISPTFIFKRNMIHLIYVSDDPIIALCYLVFVLCLVCPLSTGSSILDFDFSISLRFFKRDMRHLCEWSSLIALTYLYKSQFTIRWWSSLISKNTL